jgi:hypothetical protein
VFWLAEVAIISLNVTNKMKTNMYSYMLRLAEVAIIRLNVTNTMKRNTYNCDLGFEISYLQRQYILREMQFQALKYINLSVIVK